MTVIFGWFHLYGLLIGIGVVAGLYVVTRMSRHFAIKEDWLEHSLPWIMVGAVVGARLYHLATDWQLYQHATFLDLIAVWRGGIGFLGAVIGGLTGLLGWLYLGKNRRFEIKNLFTYLDLLVFGIPPAQVIGRLGNWANGELYGLPTNLPWGVEINGQRYHPLFLYEGVLNLILWGFLLFLAKDKRLVIGKGQYAAVYLFGYTFIRFWLEYLRLSTARTDNLFGFLSIAQWVCLAGMILALVIFWVRRHVPRKQWDFSLE